MSKLIFPKEVLNQHLAVLGKTGKGKSSALRTMVEYLLSHRKRVCIIDPKGDWWGLKSSGDGESAGFPVICFGEFKPRRGVGEANESATDVPINAQSGRSLAELVASGNRPCIIGFRGWKQAHMTQFWIDFAEALFGLNAGELYLVIDEAHNFAPKGKVISPQAGECLHWTNRIMSEGRGLGLICLIASQRPQKVHNDTLTCCESVVAMGVTHPADRAAVADWIAENGKPAEGKAVLNGLTGLVRGEAFVWSPEIGFGPTLLKFPMFETFDSFAAPQVQKRISERGWADINLDEVKAKLASVIEEAKGNDPAELKRQIAGLNKQIKDLQSKALTEKPPVVAEVKKEKVEVPVMRASEWSHLRHVGNEMLAQRKFLDSLTGALRRAESSFDASMKRAEPRLQKLEERLGMFTEIVRVDKNRKEIFTVKTPVQLPSPPQRIERSNGEMLARRGIAVRAERVEITAGKPMGKCERAILIVLAQYQQGRSRSQAAVLSGYSQNSSSFENALSTLRSGGLITREQPMRITEDGLAALGTYEPLPTGQELLNYWLNKLGKCERQILSALAQIYPRAMAREELAEAAGYSATSSSFENGLSTLRTLELINRGQPMAAREELFA